MPCGILGLSRKLWVVSMLKKCQCESHCITFIYLLPNDSCHSGLALSFGIRSKALTLCKIFFSKIIAWKFKNIWIWPKCLPGVTCIESCPATTQLQASREAQKGTLQSQIWGNMTWIESLSFLHIITHMEFYYFPRSFINQPIEWTHFLVHKKSNNTHTRTVPEQYVVLLSRRYILI